MKRIDVCTLLLLLTLAGCGGGSGGTPATTPPSPTGTTDFAVFVKSLFDRTDDTSDAVAIDALTFTGLDNEDPTLFDDVLSTYGGP